MLGQVGTCWDRLKHISTSSGMFAAIILLPNIIDACAAACILWILSS